MPLKSLVFAVFTVALVVFSLVAADIIFFWSLGEADRLALAQRFGNHDDRDSSRYLLDAELGYQPKLDGIERSSYGTLLNHYDPNNRGNRSRILFVGDSVTKRGKIIEALERECGPERFEYWNAGVEGYATPQELLYFKRYNRALRPDVIILTFHVNDLWLSRVILRDSDGRVATQPAVFLSTAPGAAWLMEHSRIYQWLVLKYLYLVEHPVAVSDVEEAIIELSEIAKEDGATLKILFHPILLPNAQWLESEFIARQTALNLFAKHSLSYLDLTPIAEQALNEGVSVQEKAGDKLHPSKEMAELFSEHITDSGYFSCETGVGKK